MVSTLARIANLRKQLLLELRGLWLLQGPTSAGGAGA